MNLVGAVRRRFFTPRLRVKRRPVDVHAHGDRIDIRQDGKVVGEQPRSFARGNALYKPWHCVPVRAGAGPKARPPAQRGAI